MPTTAKELGENRLTLINQAQAMLDEYDGELPGDKQEQFDKMMSDASDMKRQQSNLLAVENAQSDLCEPSNEPLPQTHPMVPTAKGTDGAQIAIRGYGSQAGSPIYHKVAIGKRGDEAYQSAWSQFLRHGNSAANIIGPQEFAALRSDDADQAGYLVASEQFATELLKEVDDLLFIRRYARVHTVREAESLGIRKRTTRASTFDWSSELAVSTFDTALAYGKKVLTPHHMTGGIKVSRDLVRRSIMPIDMVIREEFARDAGEKMEDGFLTGNGAQQPLGVFTASDDGISTSRDSLTGSSTNFTADGLVLAKYQLKSQYRNGGSRQGVRWLFHRDGIRRIAQLKDADNHYLFRPGMGIRGDDPDMLLGFPVDESERAPNTFTTGQYVGLLANWRYYEIADALDLEIQVLDQLYAATNEIGYIGRLKCDGLPTLEEAFVRLKTD